MPDYLQPLPLYEPEGQRLMITPEGHGMLGSYQQASFQPGGASLSGPTPQFSQARPDIGTGMMKSLSPKSRAVKKAEKKLTPEEMAALADQMISQTKAQTAQIPSMPTAVQPALQRPMPQMDPNFDPRLGY